MQWVAFALGAIGAPFVVHEPRELTEHLKGPGRLLLEHATHNQPSIANDGEIPR